MLRPVLLAALMLAGGIAAQAQTPPSAAVPPPAPTLTPIPVSQPLPPPEPSLPVPDSVAAPAAPALPTAAPAAPAPVQPKRTPRPNVVHPKPPTRPQNAAVPTPQAPTVNGPANAPTNVAGVTLTPLANPVTVALSNIRQVRVKTFDRDQPDIRVRGVEGPNASQEFTHPGMVFEFKLRPAPGWGIVQLDNARLVNVVTGSGQSLATQPVPQPSGASVSGGAGQAGYILPVDLQPEEAVIQIRTELPPRADAVLRQLRAEFNLTIGYRQTARMVDLSKRLNQPLDLGQRDVALTITQLGHDLVQLTATGKFDKIGNITITNLNGEPLTPYSTETKTENQNNVPAKKIWEMSFADLPAMLGMTVDVYPVQRKVQPSYEWSNVELP